MKQLLRLLIAVLCVLGLSVGAAAASVRVETMSVEMTVDENGTAKAEVAAHLEADAPVDSPMARLITALMTLPVVPTAARASLLT